MTFGEFWPIYFKKKELMVKRSTLAAYDLLWHRVLEERFRDFDMDNIRTSTIQAFIDEQVIEGKRSIKTIRDHVVLIKNMLRTYGTTYDLPTRNFNLTWPTKNMVESRPREKFTDKEIAKLIDYCKNCPEQLSKLVALAAMTGIRIGEASGIQFGDFDFEKKTLHIRRTVQRLYFANNDGASSGETEVSVGIPKTLHSRRTVPVPPWLCSYFKSYQKLLKFPDDAFILQTKEGGPVEPRTLRSLYYRMCDKIGIRKLPFHCLRHTYASRLILAKADIRTVSELLGHSDVSTTLNIYSHSDEDKMQAAAKKIFL